MRRGENVRIHNQCKHGPSTVNILISERTNVEELTHLVTGILDLPTIDKQYELYVYSPSCKIEQKLSPTDRPLAIRMEWPNQDFNRFEIRPSSCRIQHHHQYIDNNNNNSSNDSRLIMADFRKNFKSEFTMNLLGAATTTTNHNITATAASSTSSSSSTTTTTTTTTGKVLLTSSYYYQ
ncbi:ra domain containing protein [Dermatophagoides farinae]|uniref:Ra domain containing protein n=1 Tax=Dermatophagoides farinae TaxID=6954 RepID=A0A9D4NSE3_DERFA|nr:ra domain containing protein [Dermatophagoides farinae]